MDLNKVREFVSQFTDEVHTEYAMKNEDLRRQIATDLDLYEKHADEGKAFNREFFLENAEWLLKRYLDRKLFPEDVQVGDGVTQLLWTDQYACTVIKKTPKSVTVQRDKAILDPNWKPEWIPGGFAGHCVNQDEQSYTYEPDPNGSIETFYWSKKYQSYGQPGDVRLIKGRHEFRDYNF